MPQPEALLALLVHDLSNTVAATQRLIDAARRLVDADDSQAAQVRRLLDLCEERAALLAEPVAALAAGHN